MSVRGSEAFASALPHSDYVVREMVQLHTIAEHGNDAETVISTVSAWDQFYSILAASKPGPGQRRPGGPTPRPDWQTLIYFDQAGVREHYETVKAVTHAASPQTERRYFDFVGRWFQFTDTTFTLSDADTGEPISWRGAFLFPIWVDGIMGEVTWMADPAEVERWEDLKGDGIPLFTASEELTARLNECDEAWRSGEFEKKLTHFGDEVRSAFGIAEVNGPRRNKVVANTKQDLLEAWSRPEAGKVVEFERLHHIVSTFYVFAHYQMRLDLGDRTVVRETVTTMPFSPDRKFIGELSYSLEVEV